MTTLTFDRFSYLVYIFSVMDHHKPDSKSTHRRGALKTFSGTVAALLVLLFIGSFLHAAEIYTWMDDNGVLMITDQPPPDGVRPRHITRYKKKKEQKPQEPSPLDAETDHGSMQQQKVAAAQANRDDAAAARKDAEAAIRRAQEAEQNLLDYIQKYGTKKTKVKKHRSRIKHLAETAGAAKARAEKAIQRSNQAAKKPWEADKRAEGAETQP